MTEEDRRQLYEAFVTLNEKYNEIKYLLREVASSRDNDVASAYWLASLNIGIDASSYHTYNPTFKNFLENNKIIDEDGEYIENDNENEDW